MDAVIPLDACLTTFSPRTPHFSARACYARHRSCTPVSLWRACTAVPRVLDSAGSFHHHARSLRFTYLHRHHFITPPARLLRTITHCTALRAVCVHCCCGSTAFVIILPVHRLFLPVAPPLRSCRTAVGFQRCHLPPAPARLYHTRGSAYAFATATIAPACHCAHASLFCLPFVHTVHAPPHLFARRTTCCATIQLPACHFLPPLHAPIFRCYCVCCSCRSSTAYVLLCIPAAAFLGWFCALVFAPGSCSVCILVFTCYIDLLSRRHSLRSFKFHFCILCTVGSPARTSVRFHAHNHRSTCPAPPLLHTCHTCITAPLHCTLCHTPHLPAPTAFGLRYVWISFVPATVPGTFHWFSSLLHAFSPLPSVPSHYRSTFYLPPPLPRVWFSTIPPRISRSSHTTYTHTTIVLLYLPPFVSIPLPVLTLLLRITLVGLSSIHIYYYYLRFSSTPVLTHYISFYMHYTHGGRGTQLPTTLHSPHTTTTPAF